MPSQLEQRIRELDDASLTQTASASKIAKETGIKYHTARRYIYAFRNGYKSASEYQARIRLKNKKPLQTPLPDKELQTLFEESGGDLIPIEEIEENTITNVDAPIEEQEYSETDMQYLFSCLDSLNPAYKHLLIHRYLEGNTLREIAEANLKRITHERVRQLETKALKQLREIFFSQESPSPAQSLDADYARAD